MSEELQIEPEVRIFQVRSGRKEDVSLFSHFPTTLDSTGKVSPCAIEGVNTSNQVITSQQH